ncbi:hypothetical protein NW768_004782 [Fusarium equiseti]|uniref:C2H2-type domain-containing protein n=1 Tax=Fusarium equiseti TaxID=61235 RepID=A0ABQ8RH82_FUSEQ|nr:hypothetical protein NW768_004782 [Fusarium equiseti]
MLGDPNSPSLSSEDLARLPRPSITSWMAVNKQQLNNPEPARIVSDIAGPTTGQSSAAGALATNSRIQAAQLEWERKNQGQSQSRHSTGSPGVSSLRPPQHQRKRESPSSDSSAAKRQNNESYSTAREGALGFTEEEVARRMAELNDSSVNSMNSTMHFATGNELIKKYTGQATPVPVPVPATATKVQTTPAKSPDTVAVGDSIVAITIAEGVRPYSMYPEPSGEMISARGAAIPPNYKLHDDPNLPFICPVRDCRRLFKNLKGLGGHFGAGHCSSTFNDNGDGTLSKIGSYQKSGPGNTPGIIISRNPLPPDAPPPVDPGLSVFATFQQQRISRAQEQLTKKPTRSHETPVYPPPPLSLSGINKGDSTIRTYIHKHLDPSQDAFHREDIDFMLTLPRQRDLPHGWKHAHTGKTLDITHYACVVAYLTGRGVTGSEQCTANTTRPSARLSQPCIALPNGMSLSAKQIFSPLETCVGCRYWCHLQRRANACDWCPFPMPRVRATGSGSGRSSSSDEGPATMEIDDEVEAPIVGTVTETVFQHKRPKTDFYKHTSNTKGQPTAITQTSAQTPTTITGQSQMGNAELEMEDWEVAPGRMKDDSSNNIAFSNSYLTSNHPVTVSEDVSFNVTVLKPGHSSHWNVEDDKLRTCSVAAGKVRVTIDENTFQLGPNGMFVIRPGQACKVENRLYLDSVVHCTTIGDFSLQ